MNQKLNVNELLDLNFTLTAEWFRPLTAPWEVLPLIKEKIVALGESLPRDRFVEVEPQIWVAVSAKVASSAHLTAPCIIDEEAEIRHCAFLRGNTVIGKHCVVGNSVELKNVILFDYTQVPHYNYVGDSVLGAYSHLGAQALTSNVKSDKTLTSVKLDDEVYPTGLKKFGAIVGDHVEVGCSTVLNPATVIGRNTNIYPLSFVRGYVPADSIFKAPDRIVKKRPAESGETV